jgi:hypothetical protein
METKIYIFLYVVQKLKQPFAGEFIFTLNKTCQQMRTIFFVMLVLGILGCKKEEDPITIESFLSNKQVNEISTNPSGTKVFFLSATIDKDAPPYMCSIPFIYQISCTDGTKTLYFEGLRSVGDITVDEACNLYACMFNRIVKFIPPHDSVTIKTCATVFSSVVSDSEGSIWAGTYGDGLYYYDKYNWYRYSSHNSNITGNTISHLEIGKTGDIWLTSDGDTASITHISGGVFNAYKWKALLGKNPSVSQLAVDKDGNAWVAYYLDNIVHLAKVSKNGTLVAQNLDLSQNKNLVKLRSGYTGDLYMIIHSGEQSKLYVYNDPVWKQVLTNTGNAYMRDATIDASQNLWLGTTEGIVKSTYQLASSN